MAPQPRDPRIARASMDDRVRGEVEAATAAAFERLLATIEGLESCVLTLSGGLDSSFLLHVTAPLLGPRCLALTGDSAAVPLWDREDAAAEAETAAAFGASWRSVATKELDDPRYARNPRSRCYFCKTELYGVAAAIARSEGYRWVVDGTNASDLERTDRPGIEAGREFAIRSPLAEAGLRKDQVRACARALGMARWDRPASACLASRVPFGERITPERLRRVEAAELALRGLGFRQVRVRDFGERARVEVEDGDLAALDALARAVGDRLGPLGFVDWSAAAYSGSGAGDAGDAGRR